MNLFPNYVGLSTDFYSEYSNSELKINAKFLDDNKTFNFLFLKIFSPEKKMLESTITEKQTLNNCSHLKQESLYFINSFEIFSVLFSYFI